MNISQVTVNGLCIGCMACISACPNGAIEVENGKMGFPVPKINNQCKDCGACLSDCPMSGGSENVTGFEKLMVKRKTLNKTVWKRVTKSASAYLPLDYQGQKGMAGLFEIREVTTPLIVTLFGKRTVMADRGFHWMQIGPENKNLWLTVIFDAQDKPVEYYFDITKDNTICGEESFYLDLFIDVVLLPDGRILTLDADELEQAFTESLIGQDDYRLAVKTAEKITAALPRERFRMTKFCDKMFTELKTGLREDLREEQV